MKLSLAKIIAVVLIIALPLFIWVINRPTDDQSKANVLPMGSVHINPEVISTDINEPSTHLSALAYDTGGLPIHSGVTYQWGISTTNSIGTLFINPDDKLATFTPSNIHRGRGDIFVTAFEGTTQVTRSIPVYVGVSPTPTPTLTPSPTQEPNLDPPICVPSSIPPATGVAPLTVTLHGGGNAGPGTGLDGYRWDYDNNGTWDSGVSINPVTHTYVTPGIYNPKYQIRSTNGVWSSICNYPYTVVAQSPGTHDYTFDIFVRFAGVTDGRAEGAKATIRFINGALDLITSPRTFTHTTNGNYKTTLTLSPTQLPPGSGYVIIVKGEKHLARKYCKASGQTTPCQSQETITLPVPNGQTTVFTFTGLPLDPGDLRAQDGRADLSDFAKIKDRMNISCSLLSDMDKLISDINYSGCVDSMDAYWMRHTLETRYDEN